MGDVLGVEGVQELVKQDKLEKADIKSTAKAEPIAAVKKVIQPRF